MRKAVFAVALALAVSPALADNARPREGGSSSSTGERHHSTPRVESHGSSSSSSDSSASSGSHQRTPTGAQARHPRAGTGHGDRHVRVYGYPYYYGPHYYPYSYWDGYYGYGYGYGYRPGYNYRRPYYRLRASDAGAVRVLVEPSKTRVYVDGYYAGVADDFDGLFQRLYLAPGRHVIDLRLDGYRSKTFKIYVAADHTFRLHHDMVKGAGDDPAEDLSPGAEEEDETPVRRPDDPDWDDPDRPGLEFREPAADEGVLHLELLPEDASVYVDGEFVGAASTAENLPLPPGRHRLEVVRPGYRTVERDFEVQPGRPTDIKVELERR